MMNRQNTGFTLIELMFTLLVVAISVSLALPTYEHFKEKRRLTAAAEDISSFIRYAQSLAIRNGQPVTFAWQGGHSHSSDFCIGLSAPPQAAVCDCWETDPLAADFCAVDDVPYRLGKTDFVDVGHEFMHFNPPVGNFSFGPVRGVIDDWSHGEVVDGDWLMYLHSNDGSGGQRLYGLEISLSLTGRVEVCQQTSRKSRLGIYPEC